MFRHDDSARRVCRSCGEYCDRMRLIEPGTSYTFHEMEASMVDCAARRLKTEERPPGARRNQHLYPGGCALCGHSEGIHSTQHQKCVAFTEDVPCQCPRFRS